MSVIKKSFSVSSMGFKVKIEDVGVSLRFELKSEFRLKFGFEFEFEFE